MFVVLPSLILDNTTLFRSKERKQSKILNEPCVQDDHTRACYTHTELWNGCAVWSKNAFNSEASNGAEFGGSPNNATETLRPSAHYAHRHCAFLAGPIANQLQDSSAGFSLLFRFPLATMLTFCMMIRKRDHQTF